MSRPAFALAFLLTSLGILMIGGPSEAADVPWLTEVTLPPAPLPDSGHLSPLLVTSEGTSITDLTGWQLRRTQLRAAWLDFLGPMPEPPLPVKLEILNSESLADITRQLIRYEGEPGLFVEGYLLQPAELTPGRKFPALVALHQTTDASIDEIAGVSGPEQMQLGIKLARRGFVVFCPRCFLWQNAPSLNAAVEQHRARHPKTAGMAKMLYDARRAVDVLESLPQVDRSRIGAVGHSLGAKEALYLAAFDDRIQAAVASEGGLTFSSTNWHAPWYLTDAIRRPDFPRNHHELLALIAPRPFLILGGESGPGAADGDRSWPLIQAALPVWKLYPSTPRIGLLNHRQGHAIPPAAYERLAQWLEIYCGSKSI